MAIQKAMYTGIDAIMSAFDSLSQTPYYSVWMASPKDIIFQYNGDDKEAGRELLQNALTAFEQNGHNDILAIKFHTNPAPKKPMPIITDKTPVIGSMYVRVCDVGSQNAANSINGVQQPYQGGGMSYQMYEAIAALKNLPSQMQDKLTPIEDRLEALEAGTQPMGTMGHVMDFVNSPNATGIVQMILDRLIPSPGQPQLRAVNGFPDQNNNQHPEQPVMQEIQNVELTQQQMSTILERDLQRLTNIIDIYSDLGLLADYAEKNPQMFQMMLLTLRQK